MGKYIFLNLLFVVPSLCFSQGRVGYAHDAAGNSMPRFAATISITIHSLASPRLAIMRTAR